MAGGVFSWHGICPIVKISEIIYRYQYLDVPKNKMEP